MRWPNFVGQAYESQSPLALSRALENFYLEHLEVAGGRGPLVYYPTPGFAAFVVLDDAPLRAEFSEGDRHWSVSGGHAYEVFRNRTFLNLGPVATDQYPATISSNGAQQLFVTSGGHRYIIDTAANTLTPVDGASTMGASLDGFFLSFDITTGQFEISDLFNGLVWDPTQFQQRSLAPDPWRSMLEVNGRIYFFGEKTSEVWGNNGGFPFPYAPVTTTLIEYGIAAPFARGRLQNTAAWLANSDAGAGVIVQTRGIATQEIQTHAIANALAGYATIQDALVWGYEDRGHQFLLFDFPGANATWCFDGGSMNTWHKRGVWDVQTATSGAWRPACHTYVWGQHFVGDRSSGTIYVMDPSLGTDIGGGPIRRLIRPGALEHENQRLRLGPMELLLEPGLGLPAPAQGSDPQVLMRLSRDGGKTYGAWRARSAGQRGDYGHRVIWNVNGSGRNLVPEFVMSDPAPWYVHDLLTTVGPSRRGQAAA